MDKIIQEILESFEVLHPAIKIILLFVLLGLFIVGKRLIPGKILQKFNSLTSKRRKRNKIKKHPLFKESDFYLTKINDFDFGDKDRDFIFKTIIRLKIKSIIEITGCIIKTLLFKKFIQKLTPEAIASCLLKEIQKIVSDYNEKIKFAFINKYQEYGEAIFNLVMNDKKKGFNTYHDDSVKSIQTILTIIKESELFDCNYERVILFLDSIFISLKRAVFDIERMYKLFNGELDILLKNK